MKDLFRGELVRLAAEEPEARAKMEARWQRDSEFVRLADADPVVMLSEKKLKELFEKQVEKGFDVRRYSFSVRTLVEDKFIGFLGLWVDPVHSHAWVGIGIGEREHWGKGCGTDAMKLCLRYAFTELNVHRVSLGLHDYNPRALRSYQKAGFRLEGRSRGDVMREGKRRDSLWMGVLREEWLQMQNKEER